MSNDRDVVVVGGGIAGVSIGAELARAGRRVEIVEAEPTLAHHTTGRSAAQFLETYGSDLVRRLTVASRPYFENPPEGSCDAALWWSRPMLRVGDAGEVDRMVVDAEKMAQLSPNTRFMEADEALEQVPVLRPDVVAAGIFEPDAMELDVAAVHQSFVRSVRAAGQSITASAPVTALARVGAGWKVSTPRGAFTAEVVVNAAGAWCDRVAELAGVQPLGLHPLRRTAAVAALPADLDASGWPLVDFESKGGEMLAYCKPEPGGLLVSPADETPSEPCDSKPDEIDVARALHVVAEWTTLELRHVRTSWAGLRTFASDRSFVVGPAGDCPGFFWFAGQGGYGIQTAPALARVGASLVLDTALPGDLVDLGVDVAAMSATRGGLKGPLLPDH